ncbi:MAG: hypothetical protein RLZZ571_15 [Actinomycetota bacterium]|jgi:transcriptional regulator
MYIPKQFEVSDLAQIKKFVELSASADFVTVDGNGQPLSTLMPVLWIEDESEYGQLIMHISRGNQQWKSIHPNQKALAIVHGVQAYITPNSYATKSENGKVVPTWNYTSVHISGTVTLTENEFELLKMVELLTDHHEKTEPKPWSVSDAPDDYIASQLRAIIGITMKIEKVEAKAKLNQNRPESDRAGVIKTLLASEKSGDQDIAKLMTAENEKPNRII